MNNPQFADARGRGRGQRGYRGGGQGQRGSHSRGGGQFNTSGQQARSGRFDGAGSNGRGGGRGRGTGGNAQRNGTTTRDGDNQEGTQPTRRDAKFFFGFRRLNGYLSEPADAVILSISRNKEDWDVFLKSDALQPSNPKNNLHLVLQLLAQKIIADSGAILMEQKVEVCVAAVTCSQLRTAILDQCSQYFMDSNSRSQVSKMQASEFVEIDKSPQSFLENLHTFCQFILKRMPELALERLKSTVTTACGLATFRASRDPSFCALQMEFQSLVAEIEQLQKTMEDKQKIKNEIKSRRNEFSPETEEFLHLQQPPEDFRVLSVIPTTRELLSEEQPFLRPNKTTGVYDDGTHYLDVQFRLLREDFVAPLRDGVRDFIKHRVDYLCKRKKPPLGNIRIYREARIVGAELVRETMVYKVQFFNKEFKAIRWDKSKRLLVGSLLLFTSDFFKTSYYATVAGRNVDELKKGILSIVWEGEAPLWDRDEEYVMLECEVYFEAYRHTLQALQGLVGELDGFVMAKFIVKASPEADAPMYLRDSEESLKLSLKDGSERHISPLLLKQWPTAEELGLDPNQYAAFQAGLIQEFAIIQGPPGTGKTFIGLKLAEALLSMTDSSESGPLLVVCYTNHALDQFLEGICDLHEKSGQPIHTLSLVRVGGRCKSEKLEPFVLSNVMRNNPVRMPRHYWEEMDDVRFQINVQRNERTEMLAIMGGLRNPQGIIGFEKFPIWPKLQKEFPAQMWKYICSLQWFGLEGHEFNSAHFDAAKMLRKWFTVVPGDFIRKSAAPQNDDEVEDNEGTSEEEYDVDELQQDRIVDDILAEVESKSIVDLTRQLVPYISGTSVDGLLEKIVHLRKNTRDERYAQETRNLQQLTNLKMFLEVLFGCYLNKQLHLPDSSKLLEHVKESLNPNNAIENLSLSHRWSLYFAVVERARTLMAQKTHEVGTRVRGLERKLRELQTYRQGCVLGRSQVVGMTTTGAAKYNDLVRAIKSKVVLVEEAAEVLESHIVTCITQHCEHLILIGDHRQLRPSTTVYQLAKKYHLDISLFERMINNNLNCYQLKTQHRMRPQIADLVVGTVYEELLNYPTVERYPNVRGVKKDLFFITHTEMEKSEEDSLSKSNTFEANFLAGLCRYLVLQGYGTHQITILTTYTGQMFLLKKVLVQYPVCKGVRVTCVDNFQGEENDIILLSLVRSNVDGKIGFLNVDNRVCVAVSRARHGLFIIGNMDVLSSKSAIWRKINEKLEVRDEIGPYLTLECQNHGVEARVKCGQDFISQSPEGGCKQMCGFQLPCSHSCRLLCHNKDPDHTEYKCLEPCLKQCPNDHRCIAKCSQKCPQCREIFPKVLPHCGHQAELPCHKDPSTYSCPTPINKKLPCGHFTVLPCHKNPAEYECQVEVERVLLCNHKRVLRCHVDPASQTCRIPVDKELPCGHSQTSECRFHPEVIKCQTMVEKVLPICGHKMSVLCSKQNDKVACRSMCTVRLPNCGHSCTKLCHVDDDPLHLNYKCKKDCANLCSEGHRCRGQHKCHTTCPPCGELVRRNLKCGHQKELPCHEDFTAYECLEHCRNTLTCRHQCKNLCFQECGPCTEMVQKRVPECRHVVSVQCSVYPTQAICEELVPAVTLSLCGHSNILVPCKVQRQQAVSPKEIMKYCKAPCGKTFTEIEGGCGHRCEGTCASCWQGKLHIACMNKCERTLVCGHICKSPCSQACPPCEERCLMKCEHSACDQACGTPCKDCSEKCSWSCPHKACTKLCREPCDREPCDEPCFKILPCGHLCIGMCGEPCPPQCRICNKKELTEFFLYGNEDEDDARFVYLPDCGHAIEVEGLTYHMNLDDGEIGMKRCPRCITVITHCRRFNSVIRKRLQDTLLVKQRIFGNQKNVSLIQQGIINKLRWDNGMKWNRNFPKLHEFLVEKCANIVSAEGASSLPRVIPKKVDEATIKSVQFVVQCGENAMDVMMKCIDLKADLLSYLQKKYRVLFENIMKRKFPLSKIEMKEITRELDRLFDLYQLLLRRSHPRFTDGHSRALPVYQELLGILRTVGPYTTSPRLHEKLKELDKILETGLGVSENERVAILKALADAIPGESAQGRWFNCPNGHPYMIGQCGGAMEEANCGECGARIGGHSHRLRGDNQLATEVDGAVRPLYPTMLM